MKKFEVTLDSNYREYPQDLTGEERLIQYTKTNVENWIKKQLYSYFGNTVEVKEIKQKSIPLDQVEALLADAFDAGRYSGLEFGDWKSRQDL